MSCLRAAVETHNGVRIEPSCQGISEQAFSTITKTQTEQ